MLSANDNDADEGLHIYWTEPWNSQADEMQVKLLNAVADRPGIEFVTAPLFSRDGMPVGDMDFEVDRQRDEACGVWVNGNPFAADGASDAVTVPLGDDFDATLCNFVAAIQVVGIMS